MLPSGLDKLPWERLSVKGVVTEQDWLDYAVKVTVKWIGQRSLKYMYNSSALGSGVV